MYNMQFSETPKLSRYNNICLKRYNHPVSFSLVPSTLFFFSKLTCSHDKIIKLIMSNNGLITMTHDEKSQDKNNEREKKQWS